LNQEHKGELGEQMSVLPVFFLNFTFTIVETTCCTGEGGRMQLVVVVEFQASIVSSHLLYFALCGDSFLN
jgi:hypothetical protein